MKGYLRCGALLVSGALIATNGIALAQAERDAASHVNNGLDGVEPKDSAPGIIRVAGSSTVVRVWSEPDGNGGMVDLYSISLDGNAWLVTRPAEHTIAMRAGAFDPVAAAPQVPEVLRASTDDPDLAETPALYLVQFVTQPLEAYSEALESIGVTVHHYVPNQARVVRMTPRQRAEVDALPFVRWTGDLHPAWRLEAPLAELAMLGDDAPQEPIRVNIMPLETSLDGKFAIANRIQQLGGFVNRTDAGKLLMEAALTPNELAEVASWDDILWIDRWGALEPDMENARAIGGANYVESLEGWSGEGVRGEVLDIGFNASHVDFQSRPPIQHTPLNSDSHGAATSGIIFGDGTGNPLARGMVPDGQAILADTQYVFTGQTRYNHTAELNGPPYFATFHSSSVGSPQTTDYTSVSAEIDQMLFDLDILHCQSQSNTFSRNSRPQAWAKNIVSVGGIRHMNTLTKTDDCWGCGVGGASIGPADDGRIKPDLAHFYDNIFTVTTGGPNAYTSGFGGTSGATPIVAGHFGIFHQMWSEGVFGNIVDPEATIWENRPRMTTSKAMMINAASSYEFDGADHDLTRVHQGWGLPDLSNLYDRRESYFIIDESQTISNLETHVHEVNVGPGVPEVRFTMTYADPPAVPFSIEHRINDISMRITSPSGAIYHGNVGLTEGNWSVPGGQLNDYDTVENVFVEDPEIGTWTIEIIASELVQDGHVQTPQLDADYALVASGVEQTLSALAILPGAIPSMIAPGEPTEIDVRIIEGAEALDVETAELFYRFDENDAFTAVPLSLVTSEDGTYDFIATLPGADCDATPQMYFGAAGDGGGYITRPANAPDTFFEITSIGIINVLLEDDFEFDNGWTVENDSNLTDGQWQRGVPAGGGDRGDPAADSDGSGNCWVTDNVDGNSDVDGGITWLISPIFDVSSGDADVVFDLWYTNYFGADPNNDLFHVYLSDNGGTTWTLAATYGPVSGPGWTTRSIRVSDHVTPNDQLRVRFEASDLNAGSVVEAGIDAFSIQRFECEDVCTTDIAGNDGETNVDDLLLLLSNWGTDGDGAEIAEPFDIIDVNDLLGMLGAWGPCSG